MPVGPSLKWAPARSSCCAHQEESRLCGDTAALEVSGTADGSRDRPGPIPMPTARGVACDGPGRLRVDPLAHTEALLRDLSATLRGARASGPPEIVIAMHGFSTWLEGALDWYEHIDRTGPPIPTCGVAKPCSSATAGPAPDT